MGFFVAWNRERKECRTRRVERPCCEALEGRQMLDAAPKPDIAMLGLTTADSKSVTFDYRLSDAEPTAPVIFRVVRSADSYADSDDKVLTNITVDRSTLDDGGVSATALGEHRLTVPIPDALPINPSLPYVIATADVTKAVAESDESNNAALFRKDTIAVLVHGGVQPKSWKVTGPPWVRTMAEGIKDAGFDRVIAYNWVGDSTHPGSAAKQGPIVARKLVEAASKFPDGDVVDVQFIGHSEGAVVNSVAMRVLNRNGWPDALNRGYLKVTMLDPHSANNDVPGKQYSTKNSTLGKIAKYVIDAYQSKAKDPRVVVPTNVDDAEVYFQRTPVAFTHHTNDGLFNLWGQVPIIGDAHYSDLTGLGISHGGDYSVHDWYQENVVPRLSGDGSEFYNPTDIKGWVVLPADGMFHHAVVTHLVRPTLEGTAPPGTRIRLVAIRGGDNGGGLLGGAIADTNGNWSYTPPDPLRDGRYRVLIKTRIPASADHPRIKFSPRVLISPFVIDAHGRLTSRGDRTA
jgi:hypothetical protein